MPRLDWLACYSSSPGSVPPQTRQSGFCYPENDMISCWKYFYCTLLTISLSTALFACGAAHAQEAVFAPPPAGSKTTAEAAFIAAARQVLVQMSPITALKPS